MRATNPIVVVVGEDDRLVARVSPGRRPSRWPSRSIGITVTVLIHLLVSAPMLLGMAAHKTRSAPQDGPGSVAWASHGERAESMILLDLSQLTTSFELASQPEIRSEGIQPDELRLELVSVNPTPPAPLEFDEAELAETANEAVGDPAGSAAIFGNYMGQVAARIERAWMRPRTAMDGGRFECRARILQDRTGRVLSVDLENCNGDERWRQSLTSAIQMASPLSSPPEPWLFAERITLNFKADQYERGRTPEYAYEPESTRVAMSHTDNNESAYRALGDEQGDIELIISGSEVSWRKKKPSVTTRE